MVSYYFYNLAMYLFSRAGIGLFFLVLTLTYPLFLYLLPETGYDFIHYRNAFYGVYFDPNAPLLFRSSWPMTAEPGWFLYTGLLSYVTNDFRTFLVINFLLTTTVIAAALKMLGISKHNSAQILALMIPVQFIVIYFWSPRSALPLGLTLLFVAFIRQGKFTLASISALAAVLIHSQYGMIIGFCAVYYAAVFMIQRRRSAMAQVSLPVIGVMSAATVLVGLMLTTLLPALLPFLSFMPSFEIISSKTRYLSEESEGFRVTSLLSLIVFPSLLMMRWKTLSSRQEFDVIFLFVVFSFIVNSLFFYNVHVAGRLARASDYFLFGYFALEFSKVVMGRGYGVVVLIIMMIFPLLFADLYPFSEMIRSAN